MKSKRIRPLPVNHFSLLPQLENPWGFNMGLDGFIIWSSMVL